MKKILSILLLASIFACKKPLVQFSEAQPENTKNINTFPNKLIGKYYNSENNDDLEITKNLILKKSLILDTINIHDLSENEFIKNDSIVDIANAFKIAFTQKGDSLYTRYIYVDTIFNLNASNILRKTKVYYFLNHKEENGVYTVKKLKYKNGILNINNITSDQEISLLENLTETKSDTLKPFIVKPTKKQFREFVNQNGFSEGEVYIKK